MDWPHILKTKLYGMLSYIKEFVTLKYSLDQSLLLSKFIKGLPLNLRHVIEGEVSKDLASV
jgi:hypothetical protein